MDAPELSVVVAAQQASPQLAACLGALENQDCDFKIEILVVDGSGRDTVSAGQARVIRHAPPANIPQLWKTGIEAARGRIVALTIENCVPAMDWARQTVACHRDGVAGAGGAIEASPDLSPSDRAIYFSRYGSYILPFAARSVDDVAADNCSYPREVLDRYRDAMRDGFWETLVHQRMRRDGELLLCDPGPVVCYAGGIPTGRFFRRRFSHGRYFAARRAAGLGGTGRLIRAVAAPAVFGTLLWRAVSRVWRHQRHRTALIAGLPFMILFLTAWVCGETAGYLSPGRALEPRD